MTVNTPGVAAPHPERLPRLSRVKADRGQLEQVLVNLVVNARNAIPDGGRLAIDTGNTEADEAFASQRPALSSGRYARLRVSDTGAGMDQATLDRVFEPFFSTKPDGPWHRSRAGHRLRHRDRADGSIDIYSEVGLGTTVSVLVPATASVAAIRPEAPALFISGYAQLILDSHAFAHRTANILDKPFTEAALLSRVTKAFA